MMKKPMVTTMFFLSSLLVLSGCGGYTSTTSVVESIGNAAQKNAELDNARFETILSMDSDAEPFDQSSEGTFVKKAKSDYYCVASDRGVLYHGQQLPADGI